MTKERMAFLFDEMLNYITEEVGNEEDLYALLHDCIGFADEEIRERCYAFWR